MPLWTYHMPPLWLALLMLVSIEAVSLAGLLLVRRFLRPRIRRTEGGVNDAVSGVVAAIGVFYGITVGLLAVGVWNTWETAAQLVSKEAATIAVVYNDVSSYPAPARSQLQSGLRDYTKALVDEVWPAQREGRILTVGARILDDVRAALHAFEPTTPGQTALHTQTLQAFDRLSEYHRLRDDAVDSGLSRTMWAVIWLGAVISISVTYFYDIEDPALHCILVALVSAFLALTIFTIGENDKPFYGQFSIPADSYRLILQHLLEHSR